MQIFNDEKITINDREFKTRFKNALFTRLGVEFLSEGKNFAPSPPFSWFFWAIFSSNLVVSYKKGLLN